jgi:hypothetical protein
VSAEAAPDTVELEVAGAVATSVEVLTADGSTWIDTDTTPRRVSLELHRHCRIINNAGGGLFPGWYGGDRGFLEPDVGQYDEPDDVFSWCGGAVLLGTAYLRDVGLFDPHFFLYYEDFDLSWRGRSLGWRYRYVPTSVVLHEHAYSSKAGSAFFTFWVRRNRCLTLIKNGPANVAWRATLVEVKLVVRQGVRLVYRLARYRELPSRQVLADWWTSCRSFPTAVGSALRDRRRMARRRRVPLSALAGWTMTR